MPRGENKPLGGASRSAKASLNEMKTKVDARADALESKTADVEAKLDSKVANLEAKLDTILHVLQQLQQDQIEFVQQPRLHRVQVSSLGLAHSCRVLVRRFVIFLCLSNVNQLLFTAFFCSPLAVLNQYIF